ncbi:hypothetical protein EDB83DRAFT_2440161 [Lactarius deliciosus]|nr:hypothetical protein EDB83DRAFT_2440161 [Lactarius deliciosus]
MRSSARTLLLIHVGKIFVQPLFCTRTASSTSSKRNRKSLPGRPEPPHPIYYICTSSITTLATPFKRRSSS